MKNSRIKRWKSELSFSDGKTCRNIKGENMTSNGVGKIKIKI